MELNDSNPKSKTIAVLMAIFLGFWTWLYTYRKDGWKFWFSLSLTLAGMLVMAFTTVEMLTDGKVMDLPTDPAAAWVIAWVIAYIITIGLWIWGIVDRTIKKNTWYDNYPG